MKICKKEATPSKLQFNDIDFGDVLTFPKSDGWSKGVFMRVWVSGSYGKTIEELDEITLVRLDSGTTSLTYDRPQGQTYTLSRKMMGQGIVCGSRGVQRYLPVRHDACITLGEEI